MKMVIIEKYDFTGLPSSISICFWNDYLFHIYHNFTWPVKICMTEVYMTIKVYIL